MMTKPFVEKSTENARTESPEPDSSRDLWVRVGGASGIALVILIVTATILGAALRPGYSHIRDSISELIEVGAPNKALLGVAGATWHDKWSSTARCSATHPPL